MILETRQRRFLAEINVIPLVDVVLVLLVIFMVTAPMLYRGMDIKLPTSASNTIKPEIRAVLTIEKISGCTSTKIRSVSLSWSESCVCLKKGRRMCRCISGPTARCRMGWLSRSWMG